MKVLIIEDELLASERLEKLIKKLRPKTEVTAKLTSIKESVKWLTNNHTDLIFLDIQLSDGLSFSIFNEVSVSVPIILTTAYDQYAIKAFKLNSIDYLLKPVNTDELEQALIKFETLTQAYQIDFQKLLENYQAHKPIYKERFLINIGNVFKKVDTKDIAYFYALDKSVFIKTFQNKSIYINYSLDVLEKLVEPRTFFRINRRYLINLSAIEKMYAWSRSRIKLELTPEPNDKEDVIVSVSRSSDFKEWMNK